MTDRYETVVEFIEDNFPQAKHIAVCGLFRSRGGASRVVEQQAIDLTEAGYDVTVFAIESDMATPEDVTLKTVNPVHGYPLLSKVYWLLFPLFPWMLSTVFRLRSFDIIIAHRYPFTVISYIASRTSEAIYTYWSHPSGDSAGGFSGIAKIWSRLIHRFETRGRSVAGADYVCAVSENSKQYIESYIDPPVSIVPNKINERRFSRIASPDELKNRYGIDETDQIVLFVGRITERKNVHTLVRIFENIVKDVENCTLVIAGSESQPEYASHVKNCAGKNVIFTDYVSDEELAGLYSIADVFATCSLEEGWGLPITEAHSFNTFIVAFESHPAALSATNKALVEEEDYDAFERVLRDALK